MADFHRPVRIDAVLRPECRAFIDAIRCVCRQHNLSLQYEDDGFATIHPYNADDLIVYEHASYAIPHSVNPVVAWEGESR